MLPWSLIFFCQKYLWWKILTIIKRSVSIKNMKQALPIQRSDQILGGTPVFSGTRVPLQNLLDYLEDGKNIDDFLADFPTVTREQVLSVLEAAKESLNARAA